MFAFPSLRSRSFFRVALAFALAFLTTSFVTYAAAKAESSTIVVRGVVRSEPEHAPVASATIRVVDENGGVIGTTVSDERGRFAVTVASVRTYRIEIAASGFKSGRTVIAAHDAGAIDIALRRTGALAEIGSVAARPSSTDGTPARTVSAETLGSEGTLRVSDALARLPGLDFSGDAAAPGGDAYVSLRGLRPSESATLLDGHPIGPIGVRATPPDADGTIAGFNFQDAPYFALRGVDVTFGAAPSASLAGDTMGGTIDLRTFDPTARRDATLQQGFGTQGRAFTDLRASGTTGAFGYALAYGVTGTFGSFDGGPIAQTGLRGTDLTSATLRDVTYPVSGDYVLRNDLVKIVYAPSANANVTLTAYGATSWADKTGEGDNDFNPFAYTLANAPIGVLPSCSHGVSITSDAGPACLAPAAYAADASGPAGGGPGAWQALRNQDYDARATVLAGSQSLSLDAYTDAYAVLYHRDASVVSGPLDAFLDRWSTRGVRVTDAATYGANALAAGASFLGQRLSGDATNSAGTAAADLPISGRSDASAFVRDTYAVTPALTMLLDASLTSSSIDPRARFDPRLGIAWHVDRHDTFHVAAGTSTDEPGLDSTRVDLLPIGALNPNCGAIARASPDAPVPVNVGSGPPNALGAETATNLEIGYEHRFDRESELGITAYDTNVAHRIVTGEIAAGSELPAAAISPLFSRIADFCGISPPPGAVTFTLDRAFNAATARLRGIEFGGRTRVSKHLAFEYGYDVQSVVLNGLSASVLRTDPTLVNGAQAFEIPLQKATVGVHLTAGQLELHLDARAVGANNPQQLPGYAYADASIAQMLTARASIAVAIANLFDSHAQTYGLVGSGVPYASNGFGSAAGVPFLQPFNERYGLQPTTLTVNATLHL